jgi:tetratricopeptide (TPR) repeat protein
VNKRTPIGLVVNLSLLCFVGFAAAQDKAAKEDSPQRLELQFQSAVAEYHSGKYSEAAAQLEKLLPQLPTSYEVHELLGLLYAAESLNGKAVDQLQRAVQLKPDSPEGRTNLATALTHDGKTDRAGEEFRRALALEPDDYEANHNLGEFYIGSKRIIDALPMLERAHQLNPAAYDNNYDLALAYLISGQLENAAKIVKGALQEKNSGEMHNLLGQIDEKRGEYVSAATEFATAAHLDPSEDNLFAWGSELLLHKTTEPATEVFRQAVRRYPNSPRLWIGLGMTLYLRTQYEESIKSLLTAADLDPGDPRCYVFLSHAYLSAPEQADAVIQSFRRYAELQPNNALAQYYYALSLWKAKRVQTSAVDFRTVESLLDQAVSLDGTLADAHLQLGILHADQHEYDKAFSEYQRALELDPALPDAHYRMGQYYVHSGQKDHATQEFSVYQQLQAKRQADIDKKGAEVEQFIYSVKHDSGSKP